ncbi:hypothetical protein [Faecalimonas sp.]
MKKKHIRFILLLLVLLLFSFCVISKYVNKNIAELKKKRNDDFYFHSVAKEGKVKGLVEGEYYYEGKQENINYIFEHDIFQYKSLSFENYIEFKTGDYYPFSEEAVCDFTIKGSCLKQYEEEIDALFSNCPYLYTGLTGKNEEDNKISFIMTRRIMFTHHIGQGINLTNTGFSDGEHGAKIRKIVYEEDFRVYQKNVDHAIKKYTNLFQKCQILCIIIAIFLLIDVLVYIYKTYQNKKDM